MAKQHIRNRVDANGAPSVAFFVVPCSAVIVLLLMSDATLAFQLYQSNIPNGDKVMRNGVAWYGVGHSQASGASTLNVFGTAFSSNSHFWTQTLCQADSDGDGFSNGMELGDPDCTWSIGATPSRDKLISHPGYADSVPLPTPTNTDSMLPTRTATGSRSLSNSHSSERTKSQSLPPTSTLGATQTKEKTQTLAAGATPSPAATSSSTGSANTTNLTSVSSSSALPSATTTGAAQATSTTGANTTTTATSAPSTTPVPAASTPTLTYHSLSFVGTDMYLFQNNAILKERLRSAIELDFRIAFSDANLLVTLVSVSLLSVSGRKMTSLASSSHIDVVAAVTSYSQAMLSESYVNSVYLRIATANSLSGISSVNNVRLVQMQTTNSAATATLTVSASKAAVTPTPPGATTTPSPFGTIPTPQPTGGGVFSTPTPSTPGSSGGCNDGCIAGIVVGVVLVLALVCILGYWLWKKSQKKHPQRGAGGEEDSELDAENHPYPIEEEGYYYSSAGAAQYHIPPTAHQQRHHHQNQNPYDGAQQKQFSVMDRRFAANYVAPPRGVGYNVDEHLPVHDPYLSGAGDDSDAEYGYDEWEQQEGQQQGTGRGPRRQHPAVRFHSSTSRNPSRQNQPLQHRYTSEEESEESGAAGGAGAGVFTSGDSDMFSVMQETPRKQHIPYGGEGEGGGETGGGASAISKASSDGFVALNTPPAKGRFSRKNRKV